MTNNVLKHIPNALTIFRLILIIPFLYFLLHYQYTLAFYLFLLASFTDGLDGWLARHYGWLSPFGSFMDPLADKLLAAASFISLALLHRLPWWLVLLVFMRDLTISLGVLAWYWLIQRELDFKPSFLSKVNTSLQLLLVILCLFELAFFNLPTYYLNSLIILTAITTAITYINYVWTWSRKAFFMNKLPQ